MFRHLMISINMPEFIKIQANQITSCLSKKKIKSQYKNPTTASQRKKIIKIGKRR